MRFEQPPKFKKEEEVIEIGDEDIIEEKDVCPADGAEEEIKIEEEARREARRLKLNEKQTEFYVEIMLRSAFKGSDEPRFWGPFDSVETEQDIFDLVGGEIEKFRDFEEATDELEYYGENPKFFSRERKSFREMAEKAREIAEEEKDPNLPPLDPLKEFEKFEKFRVGNWNSELVEEFKDNFERELTEQRRGVDYLRSRMQREISESLQTSAGLSFEEIKMVAENFNEYQEFMKERGISSLSELFRPSQEEYDFKKMRERMEKKKEGFRKLIEEKRGIYRLTDERVEDLEEDMEKLMGHRFRVALLRSKFSNDDDLFENVTGHKPKGKIEIIENPFSLYFRCENEEDFAYFFSQKVLSKGDLEERDIQNAARFGGRAVFSGEIFTAEKNVDKEEFDGENFMLNVHENQHAIDFLLREMGRGDYRQFLLDATVADGFIDFDDEENREKNIENVKEKLIDGLREFREFGEWRAVSEINAHLMQGCYVRTLFETLKRKNEEGGLYNYFNKELRDEILDYADVSINSLPKEEIRDTIDRVLVTVYHKQLDSAQEAIELLEQNKFSRDKIVFIFRDLPLGSWLAEAKAKVKQKKERGKNGKK